MKHRTRKIKNISPETITLRGTDLAPDQEVCFISGLLIPKDVKAMMDVTMKISPCPPRDVSGDILDLTQ